MHLAAYRYYFKPPDKQRWRVRLEDAEHFLVPLEPQSQHDPTYEISKYGADMWVNPTLPTNLANPFLDPQPRQKRWVIKGMSGGPLYDVHANGQVVKSATVHGVVSYTRGTKHVFCPILAKSVEAINLFMSNPNGPELRQRFDHILKTSYPADHDFHAASKFGAGYYADRQGNKLQTVNPGEANVGYWFLNRLITVM